MLHDILEVIFPKAFGNPLQLFVRKTRSKLTHKLRVPVPPSKLICCDTTKPTRAINETIDCSILLSGSSQDEAPAIMMDSDYANNRMQKCCFLVSDATDPSTRFALGNVHRKEAATLGAGYKLLRKERDETVHMVQKPPAIEATRTML